MSKYELDDITEVQSLPTKITWKKQVQAKIKAFCEEQLKTEIRDKYSKLDNIDIENENSEAKEAKSLTSAMPGSSSSSGVGCWRQRITST